MTERDMELFRDIQEQALQVNMRIQARQSGTVKDSKQLSVCGVRQKWSLP